MHFTYGNGIRIVIPNTEIKLKQNLLPTADEIVLFQFYFSFVSAVRSTLDVQL